MQFCPQCSSEAVRRSQIRGLFERLRKRFTLERPHRCQACGWRGWGTVSAGFSKERLIDGPVDPDLAAIDVTVARKRSARERPREP
jgi:hypothetical protein